VTRTSLPQFFRLPGYPFFLAALFSIAPTMFAVPVVQTLIIALNCCFIYLLGRRYFSRGAGIAAAILYALDPTTWFLAMQAVTEPLYVSLILGYVLLASSQKERRFIPLILAGVL